MENKNNMLIAEFLGYVNTSPEDPDFNFYEKEGCDMIEAMSMNYHKSLDALLPVLEEIEKKGFKVSIGVVPSIRRSCLANLHVPHFEKSQYKGEGIIERTYLLFVEFIKSYNEQTNRNRSLCST